jgi:hypothetical protein
MKGKMKGEKEGNFFFGRTGTEWRKGNGLWKTTKDEQKLDEKRIALQEMVRLTQEVGRDDFLRSPQRSIIRQLSSGFYWYSFLEKHKIAR